MVRSEYAVVGGGLVGMAIAYGLARIGKQVAVLDEGDDAFRASRGNFGLIWVQGKGASMPDYARWTRRGAALWPQLAAELNALTGVDVELSQIGGLEGELEAVDGAGVPGGNELQLVGRTLDEGDSGDVGSAHGRGVHASHLWQPDAVQ